MGGRPSKPHDVHVAQDNASHLTKLELRTRKKQEDALATGVAIKEYPEVKNNKDAHVIFRRCLSLLEKIGKHDAMSEPILNRYALLTAECNDLMRWREESIRLVREAERMLDDADVKCDPLEAFKAIGELQKMAILSDKQVQNKRKMLFDIEKEMLMTVAAQMRSIPKKQEQPEAKAGFGAFVMMPPGRMKNSQ